MSTLMTAAGLAAFVALPFVLRPSSPEWVEWLVPIRRTALAIGPAFLIGGVGGLFLLPPRREVLRFSPNSNEAAPLGVILALIGLAAAAAAQVPMLLAWWDESGVLVRQLIGVPDPLGLWIIPATLVSAPPFLASLLLGLFVLTSIAAAAVRGPLATSVLWACVTQQSGIVIGSALALPEVRSLVARVLALASSGPDVAGLTAITAAIGRQDFFASTLLLRFEWILGGYLAAGVMLWHQGPDGMVNAEPSTDARLPTAVAPSHVLSDASLGDLSNDYRVRLRTPRLLAAFGAGALDYEIVPLASRTGGRFVFLGRPGVLQREPDGPPLLRLQREGAFAMLGASYLVKDASTNVPLATFKPEGNDWVIIDRFEKPIARIEEVERRPWYCRYRLQVDGAESCRFTWGMQGPGVWTAEMLVEFSAGPAPGFDRGLALAFAPVLEARARRTTQTAES